MLTIRPYVDSDLERIKELHGSQGFDYEFLDFGKPEFIIRSVIENGNKIEAGLFLRKTAEAYLLMQPMTRKAGIGRLLIFNREIPPLMKRQDLSDVHCWIPPEVDASFGKLLLHLGWQKQLWSSYSRKVG